MSAEVGAASVLEELLELLEVDLSTAATAVCKYTNRAGGTSHFARLIRTASQLQAYSAPVTRNKENIIVKLRQGSGKDRQGMVKGERP